MATRDQAQALNILITREIPTGSPTTPPQLDPLGQPLPTPTAQTVTQHVPARRYDPALRDETRTSDGKYFGVDDSRWTVRQDATHPWKVTDVFTDESGTRRRIISTRNAQQQGHVAGALIELIGSTS